MTIDGSALWLFVLTTAVTALGWLVRSFREDIKNLEKQMNHLLTTLHKEYVQMSSFDAAMVRIEATLVRMESKLDVRLENVVTKLETKADKDACNRYHMLLEDSMRKQNDK